MVRLRASVPVANPIIINGYISANRNLGQKFNDCAIRYMQGWDKRSIHVTIQIGPLELDISPEMDSMWIHSPTQEKTWPAAESYLVGWTDRDALSYLHYEGQSMSRYACTKWAIGSSLGFDHTLPMSCVTLAKNVLWSEGHDVSHIDLPADLLQWAKEREDYIDAL